MLKWCVISWASVPKVCLVAGLILIITCIHLNLKELLFARAHALEEILMALKDSAFSVQVLKKDLQTVQYRNMNKQTVTMQE